MINNDLQSEKRLLWEEYNYSNRVRGFVSKLLADGGECSKIIMRDYRNLLAADKVEIFQGDYIQKDLVIVDNEIAHSMWGITINKDTYKFGWCKDPIITKRVLEYNLDGTIESDCIICAPIKATVSNLRYLLAKMKHIKKGQNIIYQKLID